MKYVNRYGVPYDFVQVRPNVYNFRMDKNGGYGRYGTNVEGDVVMYDPEGGPYLAVDNVCQVGKIQEILFEDSEVFVRVYNEE